VKNFNKEFVNVDAEQLLQLVRAAYYLKIERLQDITFQAFEEQTKGKTPGQIRQIFINEEKARACATCTFKVSRSRLNVATFKRSAHYDNRSDV
jgi:hypothetical protein